MKLPDGTKVKFIPQQRHDTAAKAAHTGTVVYFTADCFYRIKWDEPNPDSEFFNLGNVFRPDQLVPTD